MITGRQIRMARAALGWSIDNLADEAGVHKNTVVRLEKDMVDTRRSSIEAIQRTLEAAGVRFVENGVVMAGAVLDIRERLGKVHQETINKFVYEFGCWLWETSKSAMSAHDIQPELGRDSAFASAIAQTLVEMGDTSGPTPEKLAAVLNALCNQPVNIAGDTYTIVSEGDHGGEIMAARWKVIRGV